MQRARVAVGTLREVHSQARNVLTMRSLWSPSLLLRALPLPYHWYVKRDGSAPPPLALGWYITYACPEKCTFCNVTHALEEETWRVPPSEEDQKRIIEELVPRIPAVAIGGGEPMAHPGIIDRVAHIKHRGGKVFVVTSATTMGRSRARALAAAKPDVVTFSLLGDEQVHDKAMGRKGAWARTVGGISNFLEVRNPAVSRVVINCAVSLDNAHGIRQVAETGAKLGVDQIRFTWLSFLTEQERAQEQHDVTYFVIPDDELKAFNPAPVLREARSLEREHPGLVSFQPQLNDQERAAWFTRGGGVQRHCFTLWHTLFLRPDGSVVPCGHLFDDSVGNVLEQDLDSLWNTPRLRELRRSQWKQPFAVCRRCCKV